MTENFVREYDKMLINESHTFRGESTAGLVKHDAGTKHLRSI